MINDNTTEQNTGRENFDLTMRQAKAAGFVETGSGAVRAIREAGFAGLDYVTLYNAKRGLDLRVYPNGDFRISDVHGDRFYGEAGELSSRLERLGRE
jgi:hypothetical protein